jgi:hypothetical protein
MATDHCLARSQRGWFAMVKKALVEPTPSRMDQVSMIECGCCPYADNAITPRRSQSAGQNMLVISTHFSASAPWTPNDLPNAIKQLKDQELDLLLSAVLAEEKGRGKRYSDSNEGRLHNRRIEAVSAPLTQAKFKRHSRRRAGLARCLPAVAGCAPSQSR